MDTLALLEIGSLARGLVVVDAALKRAHVELLSCEPTTPGKYLVLLAGGVGEIEEAVAAGAAAAGDALLDRLLLPQAHAQLLPAVRAGPAGLPAVGARHANEGAAILELLTVAAALRAADAACKASDVELQLLHLARGIGGKGYFVLRGRLPDLEAAVLAGSQAAGSGLLVGAEIIARPHPDLRGKAL